MLRRVSAFSSRATLLASFTSLAALFGATSALAGGTAGPVGTVRVIGESDDGRAYAVVFVGVFAHRDYTDQVRHENFCGHAATPYSPAGADFVDVEVREVRGTATAHHVIALPLNPDRADADAALCEDAATIAAHVADVDAALAARKIKAGPPRAPLAKNGAASVIPKSAMAPFGVDVDVLVANDDAAFSARAPGFVDGAVFIQNIKVPIASSSNTATLLEKAPVLFVTLENSGAEILARAEVPLARIAVRLLTARGQATKSAADLERALSLDPSFAPAQKALATLKKP